MNIPVEVPATPTAYTFMWVRVERGDLLTSATTGRQAPVRRDGRSKFAVERALWPVFFTGNADLSAESEDVQECRPRQK